MWQLLFRLLRSLSKDDLPFAKLGPSECGFHGRFGKEADGLKFLDGGCQFAFDFMGVVAAAEADVFGGELAEVKFQLTFVPESLVEKSVHLSRHCQLQVEVDIEVDTFQVAGLETLEDDVVPCEARATVVARWQQVIRCRDEGLGFRRV